MSINVSNNSVPSDLKITDMRITVIGEGGWRWPIIKIYTNQDIYGLGEVRDGASARYALSLKSKILGQNPCNIDKIFQKLKQFGGHGRLAGGVCGIEMALCDLAGKAYGIPAYMLAGGKYRENIKVYADTPLKKDPEEMGNSLKERMKDGFEFLKMDIGLWIAAEHKNGVINKKFIEESNDVMHPFTGCLLYTSPSPRD